MTWRPVSVLWVLVVSSLAAPGGAATTLSGGFELPGHQWTTEPARMQAVPTLWQDPGTVMDPDWQGPRGMAFDPSLGRLALTHQNGVLLFDADDARYKAWVAAEAPERGGRAPVWRGDGGAVGVDVGGEILLAGSGHEGWERCLVAAEPRPIDTVGSGLVDLERGGIIMPDRPVPEAYTWNLDGQVARYACHEETPRWSVRTQAIAPPVWAQGHVGLFVARPGAAQTQALVFLDEAGEVETVGTFRSEGLLRIAVDPRGTHVAVADGARLTIYEVPSRPWTPLASSQVATGPPLLPVASFDLDVAARPELYAWADGGFLAHAPTRGIVLYATPQGQEYALVLERHDVAWLQPASDHRSVLIVEGPEHIPRLRAVALPDLASVPDGVPIALPPGWIAAGGPEGLVAVQEPGAGPLHLARSEDVDNAPPVLAVDAGDDRCVVPRDDDGVTLTVHAADPEDALGELYHQPVGPATSPYGPARLGRAFEPGQVTLPADAERVRFVAVDARGAVAHMECVMAAPEAPAGAAVAGLLVLALLLGAARPGRRA